jgi:hypothetical protein
MPKEDYQPSPLHRNNAPTKSQWTISEADERTAFETAEHKGWLIPSEGWGLHLRGDRPSYLGLAQDRARELFIAKFVGSGTPIVWHGYPADHQLHRQDVPPELVLNKWMQLALVPPAKIRKIAKAQRCRL